MIQRTPCSPDKHNFTQTRAARLNGGLLVKLRGSSDTLLI